MLTIPWKSVVWLPNEFPQEIRIQADGQSYAKAMLEAHFGKGSILCGPWSVFTR
jgi:hypothetical protein